MQVLTIVSHIYIYICVYIYIYIYIYIYPFQVGSAQAGHDDAGLSGIGGGPHECERAYGG
jgi:hypothetical protein